MKKTNKRAFTIVELVIVMAIIAVLAGVLIPTFSNLIKKTNVSSDTQLVRNLNTALAIDNKEHKTMQSVLDAAAEGGFDVTKITSKISENEILWDSKNDVFCYLNADTNKIEYVPNSVVESKKLEVGNYLLWKISDDVDPTYSTYLYGYDTTVEEKKSITTTKGLDVGETEGIVSITYERSSEATPQTVVIRTNSFNTILTINASTDTVKHYDKAYSVDIIQCAMQSYHEYGTITSRINIAQGHVHLESGSSVANINVKALEDGENTVTPTVDSHKITVEKNVTITNVYSTVSGVAPNVDGEGKDTVAIYGTNVTGTPYQLILRGWATTVSLRNIYFQNVPSSGQLQKEEENIITFLDNQKIATNADSIFFLAREGYDVTIDLNGFALEIYDRSSFNIGWDGDESNLITVYPGPTIVGKGLGNVTIKNGTIKSSGTATNVALLKVNANSILNLENVTIETTGSGVFSDQKASSVTIKNSVINAKGFGIGTNAGEGSSEDVTINVESTKIYSGGAAICLNVSGTLNVKDSYIEADEQCVMVRAGNAIITDSNLHVKYFDEVKPSFTNYSNTKRSNESWADGNAVMCGAVIVGDYQVGAYQTEAYCTLNNVAISSAEGWTRGVIVLSADSDAATFLTYDDKCTVNGAKIDGYSSNITSNKTNELYIHDAVVDGITKGSISVNDSVVRAAQVS